MRKDETTAQRRRQLVVGRTWSGGCACGAISVRYTTAVHPVLWSPRRCTCSFCVARGAVYVSDPYGSLRFSATDPDLFERVRFGHATADYLLCRRCGGFTGAQLAPEHGDFGIVVLGCLQVGFQVPVAQSWDYGEETALRRIRRRRLTWTPLEARL